MNNKSIKENEEENHSWIKKKKEEREERKENTETVFDVFNEFNFRFNYDGYSRVIREMTKSP